MSIYRREIDTQCCNQWMNGIRTINGQYPDDNRDFDINAGSGITIQPATGGITIINSAQSQSFVAGDNIEITPSDTDLEIRVKDDIAVDNIDVSQDADITGNVNVGGDLNVSGDIIQQGSSYETHAEQVYTTKDYIIMRDGAVAALAPGDFSGFQVEKYDGTNDGRLVIDKDGVARVGDVGDEQPLLTRDESADLTDGHLLEWDAANSKAVDSGTDVSAINTAINGKVSGTGNIGSDTKPIKIVNGVAISVTDDLMKTEPVVIYDDTNVKVRRVGKIVFVSVFALSGPTGQRVLKSNMPIAAQYGNTLLGTDTDTVGGALWIIPGSSDLNIRTTTTSYVYGTFTYLTSS